MVKREDMKEFKIVDDTYVTDYYQKGSVSTDEGNTGNLISNEETKITGAKTVLKVESGNIRYYIKRGNGQFVNPYDTSVLTVRQGIFGWTKVNAETFEHYTRFLKTGHVIHLRHAERSI